MNKQRPNPQHYSGDLRADLLREALDVIAAEGTAGVSLRALTRRLGVSHAAPKNHFASKEALFAAIAKDGYEMFEQCLREAGRDANGDPTQILEAQGLAYLKFARVYPSHFALMFRTDLFDTADIQDQAAAAFAVLEKTVLTAQSAGWHVSADPATLAGMLWSAVHGQAHLEAQGVAVTGDGADPGAVLKFLIFGQPSVESTARGERPNPSMCADAGRPD